MELKERSVFLPFRVAKLNDCRGILKKRWYIEYYAWHSDKRKLVRKRLYEINRLKSKVERYAFARQSIKKINALLEDGFHFGYDSNIAPKLSEPRNIEANITDLIDRVLELKKADLRKGSYTQYVVSCKYFISFLNQEGLSHISASQVDKSVIFRFIDFLKSKPGLSNVTINSKVMLMKAVFSFMEERGYILKNPFSRVRLLKQRNRICTRL